MNNGRRLASLAILWLISRCAAGVEQVFIPSQDGKLQIPAYWFPANVTQPRPAVIDLHGSGGALDDNARLGALWSRDASYFNAEGMHLLVPDSFTPRGQKKITDIPLSRRTIHEEDRREDVFAAIQWLARQANVDKNRIAIVGRSHGGQTVLSVLDRTDKRVKAQRLQPRAAVAFYPGCWLFTRRWRYEISIPLLLMIGELDDLTPAENCVKLHKKVQAAQKEAIFDLVVFPGSYHAFDSPAPVRVVSGIATTRTEKATLGGNPQAREQSYRRMFDFLSATLDTPLLLSHEQRLHGHRYTIPPASGFAPIDRIAAVPLGEQGRARYKYYLGLPAPKAFAITEKRTWYFSADEPEAMRNAMDHCEAAKVKCWLYAVDDRVVWNPDVSARIDLAKLRPINSPGR